MGCLGRVVGDAGAGEQGGGVCLAPGQAGREGAEQGLGIKLKVMSSLRGPSWTSWTSTPRVRLPSAVVLCGGGNSAPWRGLMNSAR